MSSYAEIDITSLPTEPVPSKAELKKTVKAAVKEIGATITMNLLFKYIGAKHKVNVRPQRTTVQELVTAIIAKSSKASPTPKKRGRDEDEDADDGKKSKKEKDPNAPKRAQTAFFYFADEKRAALMQAQRDAGEKVSVAEVAKKIGEMWKELEDKSEYEAQAAEDKKRFEKENTAYKGGSTAEKDDDEDAGQDEDEADAEDDE